MTLTVAGSVLLRHPLEWGFLEDSPHSHWRNLLCAAGYRNL